MRVTALAVYPLKGGRAMSVESVEIDDLGPKGDRRYCLVGPGGRAFTQRDDANLARVRTMHAESALRLEFDGDTLDVPPDAFTEAIAVRVWSQETTAHAAAGGVDARLARWFGAPLKLARLAQPLRRNGTAHAFGDAAALLLANAASLDALDDALAAPVPMERFRPNIVVGGAPAYVEDNWGRLRVGDAILAPLHACGRCEVTTIDQEYGACLGDEPLRTLSRLRMRGGEPVFGVRYAVERPGTVRVGDAIEPAG